MFSLNHINERVCTFINAFNVNLFTIDVDTLIKSLIVFALDKIINLLSLSLSISTAFRLVFHISVQNINLPA